MHLKSIWIYPIKSFNGIEVSASQLRENGSLYFDREFAFRLDSGKLLTAKRNATIHLHPIQYISLEKGFYIPKNGQHYSWAEKTGISRFFSEALNTPLTLEQEIKQGFPDDLIFDGPTLVSLATLKTVADCFHWSLKECIMRFRPNLIVDGLRPFEEDELVELKFHLNGHEISFLNPCNRCIVPSRNPINGLPTTDFKTSFQVLRKRRTSEAVSSDWIHFYKLGINTQIKRGNDKGIKTGNDLIGLNSSH